MRSHLLTGVSISVLFWASRPAAAQFYTQHDLVSDQPGVADHRDDNLVNAWGLTATASSPWWVANNGTGTSTLYNGDGVAQFGTTPLVVSVPNAPTGAVANTTNDFVVTSHTTGRSGPARFIFATEDGTIRGWNPGVPLPSPPLSTQTEVAVDNSSAGAVYKGLAIGSVGTSNFLYANDFVNGKIDVFDGSFKSVVMPFVDPGLPAGYGPVGDQNIGGPLFVTLVEPSGGHGGVARARLGF